MLDLQGSLEFYEGSADGLLERFCPHREVRPGPWQGDCDRAHISR